MDYKGLIELLKGWHEQFIFDQHDICAVRCDRFCKNGTEDCIILKAADAIKTLLEERETAEKDREIYRAALDKWGARMQTVVAIEELSELQKELCKAIRGMPDYNNIAEEIADAGIMLEQMTTLFRVQDAVLDWKKRKLERLAGRIKGEDDAQGHCD